MLVLMLSVFPALSSEAEEAPLFWENEWNFVDQSMDISQGIPEDALGMLAVIRERGVLLVGTEPYFPPQEFIDPSRSGQDQYVGADMELARLIAQRMGVALEIVPMNFRDVLPAVASGHCDLVISALSYTPGRAGTVTLTKGYHFSDTGEGNGLLVRAGELDRFPDLDSLEDKTLVAQRGSLQESIASAHIPHYLEFIRLSSVQEVYDALESGRADVAVVDVESARLYLQSAPEAGLALLPDIRFQLSPEAEGDRIAVRKGEVALAAFVNGVIDEILASGQYESWFREYSLLAEQISH